jgi:hypothetical protein
VQNEGDSYLQWLSVIYREKPRQIRPAQPGLDCIETAFHHGSGKRLPGPIRIADDDRQRFVSQLPDADRGPSIQIGRHSRRQVLGFAIGRNLALSGEHVIHFVMLDPVQSDGSTRLRNSIARGPGTASLMR